MDADDWAAHYDAIYDSIGVDAEIDVDTGGPVTVRVVDKTAGVSVEVGAGTEVQTLRPAAAVRMAELVEKSIARESLGGASIEFNGKTWTIHSYLRKPAPVGGDEGGELWLILKAS